MFKVKEKVQLTKCKIIKQIKQRVKFKNNSIVILTEPITDYSSLTSAYQSINY